MRECRQEVIHGATLSRGANDFVVSAAANGAIASDDWPMTKSRWLCVCLVMLAACKKQSPALVAQGSGSAAAISAGPGDASAAADVAVPADAPAAPQSLELLHAVPSTIRVSSRVRNKTILPQHIADGSMQTAWNSHTGEIVGAWIDVTVEDGAQIAELRLTVGHTGKGKKGEDYFTMNPRITKVRLLRDGQPETIVSLDPEKRDLQSIAVGGGTHVRLVVAEVKPGSKKSWREAAISELEAWGTPGKGRTKPAVPLAPLVLVGEPESSSASEDPCAGVDEKKAERQAEREASDARCAELESEEERSQCGVDPPGDPDCSTEVVTIDNLVEPWKGASLDCDVYDNVYGPKTCTLSVSTTTSGTAVATLEMEGVTESLEVDEAVTADVVAGSPAELVLRYHTSEATSSSTIPEDAAVVVCRAAPSLSCTDPIPLSGTAWLADVTFKDGAIVLFATKGTPPADVIGTKPLLFR